MRSLKTAWISVCHLWILVPLNESALVYVITANLARKMGLLPEPPCTSEFWNLYMSML